MWAKVAAPLKTLSLTPRRLLLGACLWSVALLSGCVTVPRVYPVGAKLAGPEPAGPAGESMHLVCWNVHKAGDERFRREVKDLLDRIPDDGAVVLCLQEVRSSTYELIRDLHREDVSGYYAASWRPAFSSHSTGVMTVGNRFLPADRVQRLGSPRRELYVASPKVSLRTGLPLANGKTLQIVNCHGMNFVRHAVFEKQLDEIFEGVDAHDGPAIVCGDFNVWSTERVGLLREKAAGFGLAEAEAAGPPASPGPSWIRRFEGWKGYDPGIQLDRIFTRGLEVRDCRRVGSAESSDHLPLVLRMEVR